MLHLLTDIIWGDFLKCIFLKRHSQNNRIILSLLFRNETLSASIIIKKGFIETLFCIPHTPLSPVPTYSL